MSAPAVTFAAYARAVERGENIPSPILELVGLDPTPYQVLRHLVPRDQRRERGTFFTSTATATRLWSDALATIASGSVIVDPACGAGDLLTPAVEHIRTLELRDVTVRGCDIDADLARVASARLRLALGAAQGLIEGLARDFLDDASCVGDATHVVLNPPFIPVAVNETWASGKTNAAAVFTVRALESMRPGTRLLALLPDVLRSGSRYSAWRGLVASLARLNRVEALDVFDEHADVHVFVLDATVGQASSPASWTTTASSALTLGHFAEVRVGPVVPHRDPEEGDSCRYVTARSLSSGDILRRQFAGRKEHGPIVLVNRTSRPGDPQRIRARVWLSDEQLAVENHLLIIAPKQDTTCEDIMEALCRESTLKFLNDRIRCRHLTVRALREIPWPI